MDRSSGVPRLILASASPRRIELLKQIGLSPDLVEPSRIEETELPKELPRDYARRMAREKGQAVAIRYPSDFVIAADTVVACGRMILPKPASREEARSCLLRLSGRRHSVLGGLFVSAPGRQESLRVVETKVRFKRLSTEEIERYLGLEEWNGKAGGYAIQGAAAVFVEWIQGSYSNVVGLPLFETSAMVRGAGYPYPDRQ